MNTSLEFFNLEYDRMKSVILKLLKIVGLNNDDGIVVIDNKYYDVFYYLLNQENKNNEYVELLN